MSDYELPEGWTYLEDRQELHCPDHVGHPVPWSDKATHGCDGCCSSDEYREAVQSLRENLAIGDMAGDEDKVYIHIFENSRGNRVATAYVLEENLPRNPRGELYEIDLEELEEKGGSP